MEWLPPRIADPAPLALAGGILSPFGEAAALRQLLYRPGFDWPAFIDFAAAQDILPPLIWALGRHTLLPPLPRGLPPERRATFLTSRLNDTYAAHAARQRDLAALLAETNLALNQANIVPVLLKGASYLANLDTGWEGARPMRDIDLLIRPTDAPRAVAALTGIGFIADAPSGLISHHLPELRRPGRHGLVELHTEALAPAGRAVLPTAEVWRLAVPSPLAGTRALQLPAGWQALHAMLHHQASDDGYAQHVLALKPLWEFANLAATLSDMDWQELSEFVSARGGGDMLASWCLQAARLFHLPLPAQLPVSAAARRQATACFVQAAQPERTRRWRFLARQLARGFGRETLTQRYGSASPLPWLRHAWFLLRRYRGQLRKRLFG